LTTVTNNGSQQTKSGKTKFNRKNAVVDFPNSSRKESYWEWHQGNNYYVARLSHNADSEVLSATNTDVDTIKNQHPNAKVKGIVFYDKSDFKNNSTPLTRGKNATHSFDFIEVLGVDLNNLGKLKKDLEKLL
jgi:hypothetical protein